MLLRRGTVREFRPPAYLISDLRAGITCGMRQVAPGNQYKYLPRATGVMGWRLGVAVTEAEVTRDVDSDELTEWQEVGCIWILFTAKGPLFIFVW